VHEVKHVNVYHHFIIALFMTKIVRRMSFKLGIKA